MLKTLMVGHGEVVPARTSPTLHPPSPTTVHQLSQLALKELTHSLLDQPQGCVHQLNTSDYNHITLHIMEQRHSHWDAWLHPIQNALMSKATVNLSPSRQCAFICLDNLQTSGGILLQNSCVCAKHLPGFLVRQQMWRTNWGCNS